ncbi:H-NS family nucleoid-associated regulatory protein [Providencia rettgeri]
MNPIQEKLKSERALKKFLKDSDYPFLEKLNARISTALDEKRTEHEEAKRQKAERENKRLELLALIKSEGFSPNELVDKTEKKSAKRKPKYAYIENGEKKVWAGTGHTPTPIQQALDAGESLDSFLIKGA